MGAGELLGGAVGRQGAQGRGGEGEEGAMVPGSTAASFPQTTSKSKVKADTKALPLPL